MRSIGKLLSEWTVTSSTGLQLNFLDGVRGLAILMVVAAHGLYANPDGPRVFIALTHLSSTGAIGVQMFFAVSGFLIAYPFFRQRLRGTCFVVPSGYARRRFLKVIPPFYLTIVLLAALYLAKTGDVSYLVTGLRWATGYASVVECPQFFNTSFWSLWVEIQFYVLLPFLFLILRRCGVRGAAWSIFTFLLLFSFLGRTLSWPADPAADTAFISRRFPNAIDGFGWGVLFAGLFTLHPPAPENQRWSRLGYAGLILLGMGMLTLAYGTFVRHWSGGAQGTMEFVKVFTGLATFLIMFFAYDSRATGARLFAAPWLRFIGIVSFEWFLLHQPFLLFAREMVGSTRGNLGLYVLTVGLPLVLTFGAAVLIYHWFSHPILTWGRKRFEQSRNPQPCPR